MHQICDMHYDLSHCRSTCLTNQDQPNNSSQVNWPCSEQEEQVVLLCCGHDSSRRVLFWKRLFFTVSSYFANMSPLSRPTDTTIPQLFRSTQCAVYAVYALALPRRAVFVAPTLVRPCVCTGCFRPVEQLFRWCMQGKTVFDDSSCVTWKQRNFSMEAAQLRCARLQASVREQRNFSAHVSVVRAAQASVWEQQKWAWSCS